MSDAWAAHYATAQGLRRWPSEELVRATARRGGDLGDVLEVGCGNGGNLWFLAEHASRVVGLDASQAALALARGYMAVRGCSDRVELLPADVTERLPFRDGCFGTVVDSMTSQHVPWASHPVVYREYRRVLRPSGAVLLYHLNAGCVTATGRGKPGYDVATLALFPTAGLTCLPDEGELCDALRAAAFDVSELRTLALTYDDGQVASYSSITAVAR